MRPCSKQIKCRIINFSPSSVRNAHRGLHEAPHDVHGLGASGSGIRSAGPFSARTPVRVRKVIAGVTTLLAAFLSFAAVAIIRM